MRDRLTEFLPLLLVGVVLLVFQLSRPGTLTLPFQTPEPTATALPAAATPVVRTPQSGRASSTVVVALCNPAQPRFSGGLAELKGALGSSMGEPLECEQAVSLEGDTQQKTTTGLAYYRKKSNHVCFTTGWDHWSLVQDGLLHWTGEAVDPPGNALVIPR